MPTAHNGSKLKRKERGNDRFVIATGSLGPVPACELSIPPMTILVGPQGSGKSLVAQVLYALEDLPFLVSVALDERGMARKTDAQVFRWILDHLRSPDRAFGAFANPNVTIKWQRSSRDEWPDKAPDVLEFSLYGKTRQITLRKTQAALIASLRQTKKTGKGALLHHAIYFPTERLVIAGRRSRLSMRSYPEPLTYDVFDHWMQDHAAPEVESWDSGVPSDPVARLIDSLGASGLQGRARRHGERWKWEFGEGRAQRAFDLDMASSGQRANFAIPYIAKTLFSLRGTGDIAQDLTLLVEEPELCLHPEAQRAVLNILALLVNSGFRVIVTTHSLTLLYALNNLLQAPRVKDDMDGIPDKRFRIDAKDVAVYAFHPGERPRELIDRKQAFIDESELGAVGDSLSGELSRISAKLPPESADR